MRIAYAVQGTGNGHIARARELIPLRLERPNLVLEVWISGTESQVELPVAPRYRFSGISLKYNRRGGLSYPRTLFGNRWLRFIRDLYSVPVQDYDLILCDFEPVSAWAVRLRGGRLLEISHQAGVRHASSPRPSRHHPLGEWLLRHYAPSSRAFGFHVQAVGTDVYPPLIRREIRELPQTPSPSVLVYLPAHSVHELREVFRSSSLPIYAFVPGLPEPLVEGAFNAAAVSTEAFLHAFARVDSVLCSAGFELPTEALFHGKRSAVIPICGQYEQACNAEALRREGAWVAHNLKDMPLAQWLQSPAPPAKKWPNYGHELIDRMLGTLSARHPSTLRPQRCICSSDRSRCETRAAMSCAHKRRIVGLLDRIYDRRRGAS